MNNASSLALAIFYAMKRRETTLLSNGAFLAAINVHPRYQVHLLLHMGVDIIDEILATWDACNASSSQSSRNEQNVI